MKKLILTAAAIMLFGGTAFADDPKYEYRDLEKLGVPDAKKPTVVHANMTAGLTWVDGNAYSLGFAGSGTVSVRHWSNELTLSGGGAYVKSGTSKYGVGGPITGNATTARNGLLKLRYDRYLSLKDAVFASFQSSSDQFAGYWYRLEPQVGYARLFFKSIHQTFRGEIGYDYTAQHNVHWNPKAYAPPLNNKFDQYHSGRLFLFYENKFTPYASFSEGLELIEPFNAGKAFRLNSLTSLTTQIYKMVAIKLNFKLAFNNAPPLRPGPLIDMTTMMAYTGDPHFGKVDTQLDLVLAVTFL